MAEFPTTTLLAPEVPPKPLESLQSIKPPNPPTYPPPKVTTSSSQHYIEACARSSSRATTNDPLVLLFQAEKLPPSPNEPPLPPTNPIQSKSIMLNRLSRYDLPDLQSRIYEACLARLQVKVAAGAFIAEAADFNAVACWEPVYAPAPEDVDGVDGVDVDVVPRDATYAFEAIRASKESYHGMALREVAEQRPVFADFIVKIRAAMRRGLYPVLWAAAKNNQGAGAENGEGSGRKDLLYWHLSVMSRDPGRPPVRGAVRAVIEPFVKRFIEDDGVAAIWLEAGSPRARDVYGYFGFRVVDEIAIGGDGTENGGTVRTWCMIYTKDGK